MSAWLGILEISSNLYSVIIHNLLLIVIVFDEKFVNSISKTPNMK